MKNFTKYKTIFWDFDGVILNSMPIRNMGFELVLKNYPQNEVDALLTYHKANGGLSRYAKFRYLYEVIRGEVVSDEKIGILANQFSAIMLENLINPALLIDDSLQFIKENYKHFNMHIVSGSDGVELRKICESLDIGKYFKTIEGSPTTKQVLVKNLIAQSYLGKNNEICLIGDSINDYEAAQNNLIDFWGYNNVELLHISNNYIYQFM